MNGDRKRRNINARRRACVPGSGTWLTAPILGKQRCFAYAGLENGARMPDGLFIAKEVLDEEQGRAGRSSCRGDPRPERHRLVILILQDHPQGGRLYHPGAADRGTSPLGRFGRSLFQ
jgi:hypothetical protein